MLFKIGISTAIFIEFRNLNGVTEVWNWVFTGETEKSKWKTVREQIDQPGFLRKEHLDKCWRETKGRDIFIIFVNLSEWSWQCKQLPLKTNNHIYFPAFKKRMCQTFIKAIGRRMFSLFKDWLYIPTLINEIY